MYRSCMEWCGCNIYHVLNWTLKRFNTVFVNLNIFREADSQSAQAAGFLQFFSVLAGISVGSHYFTKWHWYHTMICCVPQRWPVHTFILSWSMFNYYYYYRHFYLRKTTWLVDFFFMSWWLEVTNCHRCEYDVIHTVTQKGAWKILYEY